MSSSLRRLAKDHAALREYLPPNYLFPDVDDAASLPDDLTQLVILITGADGTPYSQGLWRLHLKIPTDYPKNPPKATFKTRIYHPNVEEHSGAVCLETLKRDWDPKLTLNDILITISCLLIQPNPDSALNASAGALVQEDYEAFSRQARLMTRIHAPIPKHLREAVSEAQRRGEEVVNQMDKHVSKSRNRQESGSLIVRQSSVPVIVSEMDAAKENDPSHSPNQIGVAPPNTRKNSFGKRPLTELPSPIDADEEQGLVLLTDSSESIMAHGLKATAVDDKVQPPARKSPKLMRPTEGRAPVNHDDRVSIHEDCEEKENIKVDGQDKIQVCRTAVLPSPQPAARPSLRKVSNIGSSRGKAQPRTGIRRL